jgi:hypothetical protein
MRIVIHAGHASGKDAIDATLTARCTLDSEGDFSLHIRTLEDAYALQRAAADALKALQGEVISGQVAAILADAGLAVAHG